ncbi:uncharacterized protein LOC132707396 [Cylas formicarius]|uniref:uncharacterized protein LOC132707396 n=1 Tax=Cylas formicarius TaxID=197179 RepID=UPI002958361D|nr:uncharacterized protein LOC132707396 [Cylas formicarius]
MGNCLAGCLPTSDAARTLRGMLSNPRTDFSYLVEEPNSIGRTEKSFLARILKRKPRRKPVLEMVDGLLNPPLSYSRLSESQRLPSTSSCVSRDIPLQCLDARALLDQANTPTPENSLDLEWEHETLPPSALNDTSRSSWQQDTLQVGEVAASDSDWSRVSSGANSLEWDNVQNSMHSDLDTDTQFLLNEIDRLTMRALRETGVVADGANYLDDQL